MRVRYLSAAIRDLAQISNFIADESPRAADHVVQDIREFIHLLRTAPDAGRLVGRGNIRAVGVPRLPYLIYYRRLSTELRILRIRHGSRRPLNLS